jgi:segregation and condensation protein B
MSIKAKVEAVLFLTDKPLRAAAIARIVNADVQVVRQTLLELIHEYEQREGGLEIAQDNGYIIEVKPEFSSLMEEFFPIEMSAALLRTLSAIAIKQPVPQSEIIRIRGAGAYDHIRELIKRELISKKEDGRSPQLSTTKRFQEYFRLTNDGHSLRKHLRKQDKIVPLLPGSGDDNQLALPLTQEEKEKAHQIESVLEQLMEVAKTMGDDVSPEDMAAMMPPLDIPVYAEGPSEDSES